jgi:hypothetical protein
MRVLASVIAERSRPIGWDWQALTCFYEKGYGGPSAQVELSCPSRAIDGPKVTATPSGDDSPHFD